MNLGHPGPEVSLLPTELPVLMSTQRLVNNSQILVVLLYQRSFNKALRIKFKPVL